MAPRKKEIIENNSSKNEELDNFSSDLIKVINKDIGREVAYNLTDENAPTIVHRWIPSGSRLLDATIANGVYHFDINDNIDYNKKIGGLPEGRIIEIFGQNASGKSTLAQHIARGAQMAGGIVIYIDSENATSIHNLKLFGIDINKKFVFVQPQTVEEVFSIIEIAVNKSKNTKSEIPVLVIWDSLAATSTKVESEGAYDQVFVGVQARALSQGLKKITPVITESKATLVILNQMRQKIGVMFGDPWTTSGGNALPYYASLRMDLRASKIKDKDAIIGINVTAKIIKNKMGPPHRETSFQIIYGKGISDHESAYDTFKDYCKAYGPIELPKSKLKIMVPEGHSWKTLSIIDSETGEVKEEFKFHKAEFGEKFYYIDKYQDIVDQMLHVVFHIGSSPEDAQRMMNQIKVTDENGYSED